LIAASLLPLFAVALAGCAVVDAYSTRAIGYNFEAEQALDQGLLLNVVRASLRRPMQFTSVQSISGTASASGSAAVTIPFGAGGASYKMGAFGASVSGGPTFTVPVLDTQEFYSGVMRPIPSSLFDFYIHEELPREELFTLFVEKIVMHRDSCPPTDHTGDCELIFVNYPGSDMQFDLTQSMIEYLLNLGISTEQLPAQSAGGSGGSSGSASSGSGSGSSDQGQSAGSGYRFCFAPRYPGFAQQIIKSSALCGFEKKPDKKPDKQKVTTTTARKTIESIDTHTGANTSTHEEDLTIERAPASADGGSTGQQTGKKVAGFVLSDQFIGHLKHIAASRQENYHRDYNEFIGHIDAFRATKFPLRDKRGEIVNDRGNSVSLSIYTRSTEGVLYFLGEVVRHELYPDNVLQSGQQARTIQVKIENSAYRRFPELPCDLINQVSPDSGHDDSDNAYKCENLFVLEADPGLLSTGFTSVIYDGLHYWVPTDERQGKTLHVLSILKQLLALNTSAKSLPQTNTISIISP
jgi:uncharacterized membrane protein YgcG